MSIEAGGVDLHVFDLVIHNMLAVLGPASHQSSDWQKISSISAIRQQREVTAIWLRCLQLSLDCLVQKAF